MILMVAIVCFRDFLSFSLVRFFGLVLPTTDIFGFVIFFVIFQWLLSQKLMIFRTLEFSWFKKC